MVASGFDSDPQFEIISMPDHEEKENEQDDKRTEEKASDSRE